MKKWLIGSITFLFLIIAGYWFYSVTQFIAPMALPSPTPTLVLNQTPTPSLRTWTDQSEFSFSYDPSLMIDTHEEDTKNYAHIELTATGHPGSVTLWTKDTPASTLDSWIKQTKQTNDIDTTLGGLPAKKTLGEKENTSFITAIRSGYLYQIEADMQDRLFWEPHLKSIVASYAFLEKTQPASGQSASDTTTSSGTGDVEEETIE